MVSEGPGAPVGGARSAAIVCAPGGAAGEPGGRRGGKGDAGDIGQDGAGVPQPSVMRGGAGHPSSPCPPLRGHRPLAEVGLWGNIPCVTAAAPVGSSLCPGRTRSLHARGAAMLAPSHKFLGGVPGAGGGWGWRRGEWELRRACGFHCSQRCPNPPRERGWGSSRSRGTGNRRGAAPSPQCWEKCEELGWGVAGVPGGPSCQGTLRWNLGLTRARQRPPTGQPRDLPWKRGPREGVICPSRAADCRVLAARGPGG